MIIDGNRQNHQRQQSGGMILFRIISRFDWDRLQEYHEACPGSTVEHLMHGLFVLTIPLGGALLEATGGAHE